MAKQEKDAHVCVCVCLSVLWHGSERHSLSDFLWSVSWVSFCCFVVELIAIREVATEMSLHAALNPSSRGRCGSSVCRTASSIRTLARRPPPRGALGYALFTRRARHKRVSVPRYATSFQTSGALFRKGLFRRADGTTPQKLHLHLSTWPCQHASSYRNGSATTASTRTSDIFLAVGGARSPEVFILSTPS